MKKITKLLLIFTLMLQVMSPAIAIAHEDEEGTPTSVVVDDSIDQPEEDQTPLELEVDESNEVEDEMSTENIETSVVKVELAEDIEEPVDEVELAEDVKESVVEVDLAEDVKEPMVEFESEFESDDETYDIETLVEDEFSEEFIQINANIEITVPQASIDAMRAFIANNSAANPFIIPAGSNFSRELAALDWGENVSVWHAMSVHNASKGTIRGEISLLFREAGNNAGYAFFETELFVQFENGDEIDQFNISGIPQASIEAMYAFIANNSAANPFIIPAGLGFIEAINALDWGENITVRPVLTGCEARELWWGSIALALNSENHEDGTHIFDTMYWFGVETGIWIQYEDSSTNGSTEKPTDESTSKPTDGSTSKPTDESTSKPTGGSTDGSTEKPTGESTSESTNQSPERPGNRPNLPQTGTSLVNVSLIGASILTASGVAIYLKNKNKK